MISENIDMSVCIVSWNSCDKLKECLQSVFIKSNGINIEVIVFDNASSDNSANMIKKNYPEVILIENKTNIGFGRGNNEAIKRCRGDFILLLNPDIVIVEPSFNKMIEFVGENEKAGVVGCKLVNADGGIQKSYFEIFPTLLSELIWGMMLHRIYDFNLYCTRGFTSAKEVAWVVGGCMLFKREVLMAVKGFDERYFMYGEDIDICYRVHKMGLKNYYLPDIKMIHYHGYSSKKQKRRYFSAVMLRESVYRFMLAHYGKVNAFLYRCIWITSGIVRVLMLTVGYMIYWITKNKSKSQLISQKLEEFARIVSWGFGFEKWTRR